MGERRERSGVSVVEAPTAARRNARLLVIDADEATAGTIAAVLRHEGYMVDVAASLADATARRTTTRYDVVLTGLWQGEGAEDMLALAGAPAPAATVVVLSGFASLESALRALRAGAYGYLVKPVDVDELRLTVARALERRGLEHELAARVRELESAHAKVQNFNTRLKHQVDAATAELRQKIAELDEANVQLRESQEQHDRFVAMVAHEMRGPLNPIINYAQLAKRPGIPGETVERYMDLVIEQAFRLNRLVDDLQTATRLSTGQFALRREPCDIAAAVGELVDQFRGTVRERRFSLECPERPVTIEADRDRIMQAVRNLVDNAVKYSVEDGAIEIAVWKDEQHAYIRVADFGAGIPQADMKRIFEAFTRLGERQGEVAGTGLGLYITRGIVAAHHGELTVRNRAGSERAGGAIFIIALPLFAEDTVAK
ncbi:MAG TPA: ATP-binding protein [Ktedonobacterales bacterium]|nr:ATP-binding protein [Ktedonobacterales bacterium]